MEVWVQTPIPRYPHFFLNVARPPPHPPVKKPSTNVAKHSSNEGEGGAGEAAGGGAVGQATAGAGGGLPEAALPRWVVSGCRRAADAERRAALAETLLVAERQRQRAVIEEAVRQRLLHIMMDI